MKTHLIFNKASPNIVVFVEEGMSYSTYKIGSKLADTVAMLVMLKMLSQTKENYRTLYEKQVFE